MKNNNIFNAPKPIFNPDQFETIGQSPYSATWGDVSYNSDTRAITATLTLSEDPGSGFQVGSDFDVEARSGTAPSYTWTTDTDWDFTASGTGTTRTITATPRSSVSAGFYRISLNVNAFGTGKPSAAVATSPREIGDALDGKNKFQLRIQVPENSRGSMQISVKPRSFHVSGDSDALGPATSQYLGTIDYDRSTVPYIADREIPRVLRAGALSIGIDFDQEVQGVNACAFELEPNSITLMNSDIYYADTPSDDTPANRPALADRTIAWTAPTNRKKYWKLDVRVPDPPPQGIFNIWLKDGVVNND